MDRAEQAKKMSQLVAKCWSDDSFKRKLLADPAATLRAEGVPLEVPAGVSVKALENTEKVFHLVIPAKPTELSEVELEKVSGGLPDFCLSGTGWGCKLICWVQQPAGKVK